MRSINPVVIYEKPCQCESGNTVSKGAVLISNFLVAEQVPEQQGRPPNLFDQRRRKSASSLPDGNLHVSIKSQNARSDASLHSSQKDPELRRRTIPAPKRAIANDIFASATE